LAQKFPLDLYLTQGSVYETGKREALVVEKIGTDGTTWATPPHLRIDDKPLGDIIQDLCPLHQIAARFVPLLDLGPLYYVVPPETEVIVEGAAGDIIRCKGYLLKLAVGEAMPTDLMARFKAQPSHYMTYLRGTYSHGTDTALVKDAEVEVISYTPKTTERAVLKGLLMAKVANYTEAEQDLAVRIYLTPPGAPLDFILEKTKTGGLDFTSLPYPPGSPTGEVADYQGFHLPPVEVGGDVTVSIKARNISGGAISPAAGTSLDFDILVGMEFQTGL